jgi:lipid A disaccharide synthetase
MSSLLIMYSVPNTVITKAISVTYFRINLHLKLKYGSIVNIAFIRQVSDEKLKVTNP